MRHELGIKSRNKKVVIVSKITHGESYRKEGKRKKKIRINGHVQGELTKKQKKKMSREVKKKARQRTSHDHDDRVHSLSHRY